MKIPTLMFIVALLATNAFSQRSYPPQIDGADEHVYKTIDEVDLGVFS
ncbi:MAG: hypothetical protein AAF357_05300 [Verrucomicrobiota bacterium]